MGGLSLALQTIAVIIVIYIIYFIVKIFMELLSYRVSLNIKKSEHFNIQQKTDDSYILPDFSGEYNIYPIFKIDKEFKDRVYIKNNKNNKNENITCKTCAPVINTSVNTNTNINNTNTTAIIPEEIKKAINTTETKLIEKFNELTKQNETVLKTLSGKSEIPKVPQTSHRVLLNDNFGKILNNVPNQTMLNQYMMGDDMTEQYYKYYKPTIYPIDSIVGSNYSSYANVHKPLEYTSEDITDKLNNNIKVRGMNETM